MRRLAVSLNPLFSFAISGLMALGSPTFALDLTMPARVVGQESLSQAPASLALPVGVFAGGALPVERVTGALDRRAWQLDAPRMALTELAEPLRAQLEAQGFTLVFDCESRACGGFDFRFGIEVMPEPGMHVDLGDFRFIAARKGPEVVNLLISRSQGYGFVQLTRVAPAPLAEGPVAAAPDEAETDRAVPLVPMPAPVEAPVPPTADVAAALSGKGSAVLEDLVFGSGAGALEAGDYASLAEVAAWLAEDPARGVILVGHTDISGGLESNIALSKKRAQAVRQALLKAHGVAAGQVSAEGVGPLAPRQSNQTEAGRTANRRVEAVAVLPR
ncbi:OmpA family protein [Xinfangfangia sp. CPCC 101601]|uniref:OmpA family protein n=1 Tax=Pseudogemmobacter lacusdianii TaxID=3069608 RepID=A0ABU0VYP3_9RHOB|nr:OmpA family protein [Xinfangfangia sp. CPCC 101601]MDQ2066879.1 OmpA family protein [Xinfangfangia sp. CPCC 101601]